MSFSFRNLLTESMGSDCGRETTASCLSSSSEAASVVASDDVETHKPVRYSRRPHLLPPHRTCVDDLDIDGAVKVLASGISRPITHNITTLLKIMLQYEAIPALGVVRIQCKTSCVWDPFNSTSERCSSWCQSYQPLEHTSKFLASATMDETGFSERKSVGGMCEWKRGCCVAIGVGSSVIADPSPFGRSFVRSSSWR